MEKRGVIEPDHLFAKGVPGNYGTNGAQTQAIIVFPLDRNVVLRTMFFNRGLVGRLQYRLPRQTESVAEVAYVHPTFCDETLSDRRSDARVNLSAVSDGRLASRFGSLRA